MTYAVRLYHSNRCDRLQFYLNRLKMLRVNSKDCKTSIETSHRMRWENNCFFKSFESFFFKEIRRRLIYSNNSQEVWTVLRNIEIKKTLTFDHTFIFSFIPFTTSSQITISIENIFNGKTHSKTLQKLFKEKKRWRSISCSWYWPTVCSRPVFSYQTTDYWNCSEKNNQIWRNQNFLPLWNYLSDLKSHEG